jgi:hypothetical protein
MEILLPIFLLLGLVFFAGMWIGVCILLARLGGWRRLAQRYPAQQQANGKRFRMQSAKVGPVSYNGCLNFCAAQQGLQISVIFIFKPGHPPVFIPWDEIRVKSVHRFLWIRWVLLEVGVPRIVTMQVRTYVVQQYLPIDQAGV